MISGVADHRVVFITREAEGGSFVDRGYSSTATSQGVWSGELHMTIDLPAGWLGAAIRPPHADDGEQEILLPRGTRFIVKKYDDYSGHVTLEVDQTHLGAKHGKVGEPEKMKEAA